MTTLTLNIDDQSILEELKKVLKSLKISYKEEEINYSKDFLAKLEKAEESISNGTLTTINPKNIWENIK
jgi:hypothetical protein